MQNSFSKRALSTRSIDQVLEANHLSAEEVANVQQSDRAVLVEFENGFVQQFSLPDNTILVQ